jgi:arylsulfatase A-like enzyme
VRALVAAASAALAFLAVALLLMEGACADRKPDRPNVVILLADDLGFADVGWRAAPGGETGGDTGGDGGIRTPNIDRLAQEGVWLERFYTAPLCTPARAGILTGRSPLRMGLARNLGQNDTASLPLDERTLAESLRDAGYETALVGKWHLGYAKPEMRPNARGFEHSYGLFAGWIDYSTHKRGERLDWQRDGESVEEPGYATDLLAKEAVKRIEERDRRRPLFLYLAFNAPHPPLHVPPGRRLDEKPGDDPNRRAYCLMVDELDRAVGEVMAALVREKIDGDTIVLFASDNGGNPEFGARNAPLRDGKFSTFEGGIRAPAALRWTGHVKPGTCDTFIAYTDLLPTLCHAAGVAAQPVKPLDGRDRWDAINKRPSPTGPQPTPFGCEREGEMRWALIDGAKKLVVVEDKKRGTSQRMLFDVLKDPSEAHDLASEGAADVERLERELAPFRATPRLPFGRE